MTTHAQVLSSVTGILFVTMVSIAANAEIINSNGSLPGTACRQIGTSGSLAILGDGSVCNNVAYGGGVLTVDCPVASAAKGYQTDTYSSLTYRDNSTDSINCALRAEDAGSGAVNIKNVSSTGDDNNYRTMSLSGLQGFVEGQIHIRCTIPPRDSSGNASSIKGYYVMDEPIQGLPGHLGYHTFVGSNCRQVGTAGSVGITLDAAIYNGVVSGGATLQVDCPLMTEYGSSPSYNLTKLWYVDSSPSALTCTLAAEDAATTSVSQYNFSSGYDEDYYHSFSFSGSTGITTFANGYAHLKCWIPALDPNGNASYIVGYSLEAN